MKLKKIGSALLTTGFALMCLVITNPILMLKKTGSLMKTSSVLVCHMMMMTDPVMMETSGGDNKPHDVQDKFVHAVENTMCEVRESYMMAMTCHILRYAEPPECCRGPYCMAW